MKGATFVKTLVVIISPLYFKSCFAVTGCVNPSMDTLMLYHLNAVLRDIRAAGSQCKKCKKDLSDQ